jgi:hypothetical protein
MTVRAKFKVSNISEQTGGLKTVTLQPVCGNSPENDNFFKWTPSGTIQIGTINEAASKQFNIDQEFYVDFTPAIDTLVNVTEEVV